MEIAYTISLTIFSMFYIFHLCAFMIRYKRHRIEYISSPILMTPSAGMYIAYQIYPYLSGKLLFGHLIYYRFIYLLVGASLAIIAIILTGIMKGRQVEAIVMACGIIFLYMVSLVVTHGILNYRYAIGAILFTSIDTYLIIYKIKSD